MYKKKYKGNNCNKEVINLKKFAKSVFLSVLAVFIAIASAAASYMITLNTLKKSPAYEERIKKELKSGDGEAVTVSAQGETTSRASGENANGDYKFKFYKVRLEDNMLNVYVNYEKHEELLYGEKINTADLSADDRKTLEAGKTFDEMGKLTGFMENFTS